tara:strand:+ start:36313 stop:37374 length:1062 start_codon:yes stop_codon:yes gene_type:complete
MMKFNKEIKIADKLVGAYNEPFIIAEMSGNHNQSIDRALEIIEAAAATGVDAIKFQTYTADTMTINVDKDDFIIRDEFGLWRDKPLYQLYEEAHTPWDWHQKMFDRCRELGIIAFSTPFDTTAVDFLEKLNCPFYKIASFENIDIPLIEKVASTGKPLIVSTGMADVSDIAEIVDACRRMNNPNLMLLKCTSAYPAEPTNANVTTIPHLSEMFDVQVGLSDHTLGVGVAVASVALGATVVEKHFTLSRADGGVDAVFSLEPGEMKLLKEETKRAWQSLGHVHYGCTTKEKESRKFRRSLYFVEDIKAGETLTEKNVRAIRPGYGLPPKHIKEVLGRKANQDIERGTPVKFGLF